MERLTDGDRSAFQPVFVRLKPELERFAGRHLAAEEAQDAAQQALLSIFARAAAFDRRRGDALAFALGIVAWEVRTILRRRQRRKEAPPAAAFAAADGGRSPEEEAIARDLDRCLRGALERLSPSDAEAVLAFAGAGGRPDVAPATFRKRLQRALERLRAAWRTDHGDD